MNNTFVIIAISAAFIVGGISANPIVEAAGGWKIITDFLQGEVDKNKQDISTFNDELTQIKLTFPSVNEFIDIVKRQSPLLGVKITMSRLFRTL